jgi:TRAP transporter 4TM/12TM fusion protein
MANPLGAVLELIGPGSPRDPGKAGRALGLAIALSLAVLFFAVALGRYVDQRLALYLFLGGILSLAFLHTTGNVHRPRTMSVPGWLLVLATWLCCGYLILQFETHGERLPVLDPLSGYDIGFSIVLMLLILEATRRTIGVILVVLVGLFLLYGFVGGSLEGSFSHRGMSVEEMVDHLVFTANGVFGPALEVAAFLVFVFVLFGALFDRFGGGDFFYRLSNSMVGGQVGGAAKVSVLSSGLYGSVSGSPTADVVTTGSFTIPLMVKTGFTRVRASAIEAAASTGGSILPPVMGSAAFLMSDFTGIAYSKIAIAAILPALLYYFCVYMTVHFHAHKAGIAPIPRTDILPVGTVLARDWLYLVPLVTIGWGVLSLNRPSFAGALACLAIAPVMLTRGRPLRSLPAKLVQGLADGARRMVTVGVACAVAGLVIGTLSMTDLTGKVSSAMFVLASGSYLLTIVTAVFVIIVLGMGMPVPAVYALAAVLAAPALVALGIDLLAAHLLVVYYAAVSAITPPVAVAAFAAASIAGCNPMSIAVMACRIGLVAFVIPLVFIGRPELLMQGSPLDVAANFGAVLVACLAMSASNEGFLFGRLGIGMRVALGAAAIAIFFTAGWPGLLLALLTLAFIAWQWTQGRAARRIDAFPGDA